MTRTGYSVLKTHFDSILNGGYHSTGLEQLRDVYTYAFGTKIHLYDVIQTPLRVSNNAVSKIVTLIGPKNDDLKCGFIPCLGALNCVSVFDKEYLKGPTEDNIDAYVMDVYNAMCNIMTADHLYNLSDSVARANPYCAFLKVCPFYFTYHHIVYTDPDLISRCGAFEHILEKYICDSEDAPKVLKSIGSNKYSTDFEDIYRVMTCNNSVEILL